MDPPSQPSIIGSAQIDATTPQLRTLEAMLEAMRAAPRTDPRRAAGVIPIGPTAQDGVAQDNNAAQDTLEPPG